MISLRPLTALPVVGVLADGRTYRHLLYLLIAMPIAFVHSGAFSFGGVLGLLLAPVFVGLVVLFATLRYPLVVEFGEVNGEPATWAIDALPEALAAVPLGVAAVLVACRLANAAGYAARWMAVALLDGPTRGGTDERDHGGERVTVEGGTDGD